jgi:hypothetical protein
VGQGSGEVEGPGPATTAFMDGLWEPDLGLIRFPFEQGPPPVRETSWYALGLLTRDAPGDQKRALTAIETVVSKQYDAPGEVYHGSYARYAGDPPVPPPPVREFVEFDPNWRQFIGTALALAVLRYGERLGSLRTDVERSIELAATGEPNGRVQPDYSNIALMHAWLLAHTGSRREGEALARAIARRYRRAGALDEYNSPTYDGVALYGLALWRDEPPTRVFADLGDTLYDALWHDVAGVYHADLRNVAGPYSRAVGMDLRTYANLVGLWIWAAIGRGRAPFPSLSGPVEHAGDVCFGPLVDLFAGAVPTDVHRTLDEFQGPRRVRVGVDGSWVSTSWLGQDVMVGGHTGPAVRVGGQQIHPATVHWQGGWIKVRGNGRIDAVARKQRLDVSIATPGPATVTIGVPGLDAAVIGDKGWELPGLDVKVAADKSPLGAPRVTAEGVELDYPPTELRLDVDPA